MAGLTGPEEDLGFADLVLMLAFLLLGYLLAHQMFGDRRRT